MIRARLRFAVMFLAVITMPPWVDSVAGLWDVESILLSIDSFLERQMDRFPPPGNKYPSGFEHAQLIQTYDIAPSEPDYDPEIHDRADVYDTSLAAIYFVLRGKLERARALVDGIRLVQELDPYSDGRTRAAYRASNLLGGSLGCPWIDLSIIDPAAAIGNMSWQGIALIHFYLATSERQYLDAAVWTADWIDNHTRQSDGDGYGGFSFGEDCSGNPLWGTTNGRSTEHNVDVYVLATDLFQLTRNEDWRSMAQHAENFVERMFDDDEGKYWLGTQDSGAPPGIETTYYPQATDAQSWTALAGITPHDRALDWLLDPANGLLIEDIVAQEGNCGGTCAPCCCDGTASDCCYRGMQFTNHFAAAHIQCEVTAGAAMAFWLRDRQGDADDLLCNLDRIRMTAPAHDPDGIGLVATPWSPCAPSGFGDLCYPNKRHVASTAWTGLALLVAEGDRQANPLRPIPENEAIPTVSNWSLIVMTLLVLAAGTTVIGKRHRRPTA